MQVAPAARVCGDAGQVLLARLKGPVNVSGEVMVAGFAPLFITDTDFVEVVICAVVSKVSEEGVKASLAGAVPLPESAVLTLVLFTGSVTVPLYALVSGGVKETMSVQLLPTGSVAAHVLDTKAKLLPVTTGAPSCAVLPAEFVTVTCRFWVVPC